MGQRKLFCEYGPVCYQLSLWKEALRKRVRDTRRGFRPARTRQADSLPALIKGHRSPVVRRLAGVEVSLQENKRTNLALAVAEMDGVVLLPGEEFSFWALVGAPAARKGYLPGLAFS